MPLSNLLENKQTILTIVAVVILAVSLSLMMRGPNQPQSPQAFYYDLGDGRLFAADASQLPPIDAPSGAQAVRAMVFTCGETCDEANRQITYLSKYTDEARQLASANAGDADDAKAAALEEGTLVALPPNDGGEAKWVSASSPEGINIVRRALKICNGRRGDYCTP